MTEHGLPAADNDVEALILGDTFATDEESCITDAVGREVTMRGDLQQMPLADVFQSLGMSKMEGVLRVRNVVEQREIYFRDGMVRSYIPARVEVRRIGVQLVQGGLMTPESLRAILFEQKKSRRNLRELLVEHRILPEAEIDELFDHRAAEDLYGLFTWTLGSFEFYKGPPSDPVIVARFDELKAFDTNAVLMEVARRSDEWEVILETIRSVDEIIVPLEGADKRVTGDALDVLRSLDGRRSLRMLAPSMLFGLFELCRIVRKLVDDGQARFATVPETIEASRQFLTHDRKRLATALLDTLATRPEAHTYADLHAIASLFQEAGEQRRAAATLLSAAREAADPATALEMLRDARALSPRSCEVLEQLRECLVRIGDPERIQEARQVTDDYCNALIEDGRLADSLTILDELEVEQPGDSRLAFRRAIVLHKLGRREEAVTGLMALADVFKASKQRDQLVIVYEQVLKIDPRRRDVTRALRGLQATRLVRRLKVGAIVAVVAASSVAGVITWRHQSQVWLVEAAARNVTSLLANDDVAAALQLVDDTEANLDDKGLAAELRGLLAGYYLRQREEAAKEQAERRRAGLAEAASHFERGDLERAMASYTGMLGQLEESEHEELLNVVRARFQSLLAPLERLAQELPYAVPPAPSATLDARARRQALEDLQKQFLDADLLRARACLRAIEHETCRRAIDADTSARLTKACTDIVRTFALADVRRTAYQSLEANAEVGRRLQPLVVQANQHEAQHRYREAAEAYRTLAVEHPHEDDLKVEFRTRAARAEKIVRGLDAVAAATASQDAAQAFTTLRELQSEFPEVPIDKLVRLPLAIESQPSGAIAWMDGEKIGKTPLRTTFAPASGATVRLELDGYEPESRPLPTDERGSLAVTLTKLPSWTATLPGAITQPPAADGKQTVFAVDRAGHAIALALDSGRQLWRIESTDLSGLLPRPLVFDTIVVIASIDGTVRGLKAHDGAVAWERAGLPVEQTPIACDGTWIAVTNDRRMIALDAKTGDLHFEVPLPHAASGLASAARTVCCALANGDVMGWNLADGTVRWRKSIRQVVAVPPTIAGGLAIIAGEDGRVAAFDLVTGTPAWQCDLGPLAAVPPVTHGDTVLVASDREVIALAAATGHAGRRFAADAPITALGTFDHRVVVGTLRGFLHCYDAATGQALVQLRGSGRITAPPVTAGGWLLLGFEGKALQAYRDLP